MCTLARSNSQLSAGTKLLDERTLSYDPQTQETSFPFKGTAFGKTKQADQQGFVVFGESAPDDVSGGESGGEDLGDDQDNSGP